MKSLKLKLILFVVLGVLITGCSKEDDGIYFEQINEVKTSYSPFELEILELVNNHRMSIGISPLQTLDVVSSVALEHSIYMVENDQINHENFYKRQEQLAANADAKSVGENVAYGFIAAQGVLKAWLNSEDHKTIIENRNFTHFGISVEQNSDGRNYFTQIFIKR